jgi:hypothetical protein
LWSAHEITPERYVVPLFVDLAGGVDLAEGREAIVATEVADAAAVDRPELLEIFAQLAAASQDCTAQRVS